MSLKSHAGQAGAEMQAKKNLFEERQLSLLRLGDESGRSPAGQRMFSDAEPEFLKKPIVSLLAIILSDH